MNQLWHSKIENTSPKNLYRIYKSVERFAGRDVSNLLVLEIMTKKLIVMNTALEITL